MKTLLMYLIVMAMTVFVADSAITAIAGCSTEKECAVAATTARVHATLNNLESN